MDTPLHETHPLPARARSVTRCWLGLLILSLGALPLAAAPFISEFLADNESGLRDQDAEWEDWIEIFNPDPDPVDLGGYHLTDNATNLTKWTIPSPTILGPNQFLVIFASSKDRRVAGAQLHTNFKLDNDGEYLALVAPDGVTILTEFAPMFPIQFNDASYGYEQIPNTLPEFPVEVDDACKVLVPSDGTLGTSWTALAYDDTAWTAGSLGVGYDRGSGYQSLLGTEVETAMFNLRGSVYIRIPFTVENLSEILGLQLEAQFDDGFVAYLNGIKLTIPNTNAPVTPAWNSTATQDRLDTDALDFATFSLDSQLNRLREGANVLAIHGLNSSPGDEDLLIRPRLVTRRLVDYTTGELAYFAQPTPGAPNGNQNLPTSKVTFSIESKTFTSPFDVTLQSEFAGETIRYTTNGTVPSAASTVYSAPITITNSTQLRARVFGANNAAGPVSMESYLNIDATLANFSSNLPILILDTWGRGDPDGTTQKDAFWAVIAPDPVTGRASMNGPFEVATRAGLKRRGSSSFNWPKYSMTIEARNEDDLDKGVRPLGMPRESDWVLSGRYQFDRALMRNDLMYRLSNETGEYATRTRFVEVIHNVNGGNLSYSGDYFGVYSLMEKIKRDDNRVNVASIDRRDVREPDITGGYMFKKDRLDPGDSGFSVNRMGTFGWVEPKESDVVSIQRSWLQTHLNELDAALYAPNWTHPVTRKHFTQYLDEFSWLRHHWLNTLAMNVDGFRLSGYYYKHRIDTNGGKVGAGPIWDFDRTMGSTDSRDDNPRQWDGTGDSSHTWDDSRYPWWGQALRNPDFRQAHTDLWQELRKTVFSDENLVLITNEFSAELDARDPADANPGFPSTRRTPASRNFSRWPENPPTGNQFRLEVRNLQTWIRSRTSWIDSQYTRQPTFTVAPAVVALGTEVSFNPIAGVTVYYTTDGSDPRVSGGSPSSSATTTAPFVVNRTTVITARAFDSTPFDPLTRWSGPVRATFFVGPIANASNFAITELHYAPLPASTPAELAVSTDPADFEFVEMQNLSATDTIDLTDVHFVAGITFTFTGSALTSLAPGERVLIVNNLAAFEARYGTAHSSRIAGVYAPTRLDNAGERIHLVDGLGETIADFTYNDKAPWPASAGFAGYSLVLGPGALPTPAYNLPGTWTASQVIGGSPNATEQNDFLTAPLADDDLDGYPKLIEHALGTSDSDPTDTAHAITAAVQEVEVDGVTQEYLTLTFRRDRSATEVEVTPELSFTLENWYADEFWVRLVSEVDQGDGTSLLTYRAVLPRSMAPQIYMRLSVSLRGQD